MEEKGSYAKSDRAVTREDLPNQSGNVERRTFKVTFHRTTWMSLTSGTPVREGQSTDRGDLFILQLYGNLNEGLTSLENPEGT